MISKSRKLLVSIFVLIYSGTFAFGVVTAQQVLETAGSEWVQPLIEEIKAMPSPRRRQIANEISGLIVREFASGFEFHRGTALIRVLPSIADDDILAQTLRPYLESRDESVRHAAFEALSRGHGPAVDELIAEQIQSKFEKLPLLPPEPTDEESARNSRTDSLAFVYCLEGLLRSGSEPTRDVGARYLALLRSRYSGSVEGQQITRAIEQELTRAGLEIQNAAAPASLEPNSPPVGHTAPQHALPTRTPEVSTPTPTVSQSPAPAVERKSSMWPFIVGAFVLIGIIAVALTRRT